MAIKKAGKTKKPVKISLKVGDVGKTRNGLSVHIVGKLRAGKGCDAYSTPFVAVVRNRLGGDYSDNYTKNGNVLTDGETSDYDIVKITGRRLVL